MNKNNLDISDNKIESKYYDKFNQLLAKENLIETMEKKIHELEKERKNLPSKNKAHFIPATEIAFLITMIFSYIFFKYVGLLDVVCDTIFGKISFNMLLLLLPVLSVFPITILKDINDYIILKKEIKKKKGTTNELEYLRNRVKEEKESLEELKQENIRKNEKLELSQSKIDVEEELRILKGYLKLYYDLGYNEEEYYQYYLNGMLDEKLEKRYTDTGIQLAKDYLEEKGPKLTRKKRN